MVGLVCVGIASKMLYALAFVAEEQMQFTAERSRSLDVRCAVLVRSSLDVLQDLSHESKDLLRLISRRN